MAKANDPIVMLLMEALAKLAMMAAPDDVLDGVANAAAMYVTWRDKKNG